MAGPIVDETMEKAMKDLPHNKLGRMISIDIILYL